MSEAARKDPPKIWIDPGDVFVEHTTWCTLPYGSYDVEYTRTDLLDQRIADAVEAERERCVKIAGRHVRDPAPNTIGGFANGQHAAASHIAAAIRKGDTHD